MLLKEIGRKIAQAFRLARAADEKVASSIAAALDAKAEQIKEYEKRFEPEHPEPEPLPMQQVIQSLAAYGFSTDEAAQVIQSLAAHGFSTDEAACAIAKVMAPKPKPLRNLTNNWRKMHGLPMHRKPASFRRRRRCLDGRKGMEPGGTDPARRINRNISARHSSQEAEPLRKCGLS